MSAPFDWDRLRDDCVDFARRLIQTPSMSREEENAARLIAAEMERLRFDEVWLDRRGNVFGRVHGRDRALAALALNAHTDHVDPGDPAFWPTPPYAAEVVDGHIVGRGASDIKGPLAVQVYALAALLRRGERPRRDVVFCGVVEEEIGGGGIRYWAEQLDYPVDLVVLAEPTENRLAVGHRGIYQVWVTFHGRSAHASAPERGDNPNYALGRFLANLAEQQNGLRSHPILGATTVSPTLLEVDTRSRNVIPAWARVHLDFRTATESPASLARFIRTLAGDAAVTLSDGSCADQAGDETITGFDTPPDDERVRRVRALLARGLGAEPPICSYTFATDGRHLVPYGLPVVGFAPGSETEAHIAGEKIAVDQMAAALRGYVALLRDY